MTIVWDVPDLKDHQPALIDLYRKATALRPRVSRNWELLARALLYSGQDKEAIVVLNDALTHLPEDARLHVMLADCYHRTRQRNLVRDILERAPPASPDDQETARLRIALLLKTQSQNDVVRFAHQTLEGDPTNIEALRTVITALSKDRQFEAVVSVCQAAIAREPGHVFARHELAIAYALLGRNAEACELIDLHRFIRIVDLETPESYTNAEEFHAALTDEIMSDPTLIADPIDHATRGGFHSLSGLPRRGERAISALLASVRTFVERLADELTGEPDHPFVASRPPRARLGAWSVVQPAGGRQTSHIHPSGWLSGVYYIKVPEASPEDPRSGCLVLGPVAGLAPSQEPPWGVRDIRPVPGRLVLFPSHIPHATVPTRSDEMRICIAFDVIPVRQDATPTH